MSNSLRWFSAVLCVLPSIARAEDNELRVEDSGKQNQAKVEEAVKESDGTSRLRLLNGSNDPELAPLLKWSISQGEAPQFADLLFDAGDQGSGLRLSPVDEATRAHLKLPAGQGLIATAVLPQGAAARAGICQNDILLTLADAPLGKAEDLEKSLKTAADKPLNLIILHHGNKKILQIQPRMKVTFGPVQPSPPAFWIGLSVSLVDPALRSHLRIPRDEGLIVTDVIAEGPASKAGIKVNDILLRVFGKPLHDQSALVDLVQQRGANKTNVELLREGSRQTISVTPERRQSVKVASGSLQFSNDLNVLHPGFVLQDHARPVVLSYDSRWDTLWLNQRTDQTNPHAVHPPTDPLAERLEHMATEIKDLRKAIEELGKTLKDRK